ncbi:MAG: ABC transporter permease [Chloroflexi bacterium]|nr:ABC transporter permease [Chloroflexota bacterium]
MTTREPVVQDRPRLAHPPLRLRRQRDLIPSGGRRAAVFAASVILGGAIGALLLAIMRVSPVTAYQALLSGAFGSSYGILSTLLKTAPLLLAGLGVLVAFRAGIYNIGNQGQFLAGALFSTWIGLHVGNPSGVLGVPLMIVSGMLGGALWALVPGLLRALWGINEIITTLMFNYIAVYLVDYAVTGPMQDTSLGVPETSFLPSGAQYPGITISGTQLHLGFLLALVATALIAVLISRTPLGYEIRAVGANPRAALYGGVSLRLTIVGTLLLSGALSGLAGMGEIAGVHHQLLDGVDGGFEYTPIVVALLGALNPIGVALAAFGFAALSVGADNMQTVVGLPSSFISIIQALIVLFVLAGEYLSRLTLGRPPEEGPERVEAEP